MPGQITVYQVFDYDGCIGNNRHQELTPEELVTSMTKFLNLVKAEEPPNSRSYVSIGTARQSKRYDMWSRFENKSTSCFGLYEAIAAHWGVELDRFLLADLKNEVLDEETSFLKAIDSSYKGKHSDWYFDGSKVTLLYAKMHRGALLNPDGPVIINFYDDKEDILNDLEDFFCEHDDLIPENVALRLCHCVGGGRVYEDHATLLGNKKSLGIDAAYKETLREVGQYIEENTGTQHVLELELDDKIRKIRTMHQLTSEVSSHLGEKFPRSFFDEQQAVSNAGAAAAAEEGTDLSTTGLGVN
jgi:hypothetical protein